MNFDFKNKIVLENEMLLLNPVSLADINNLLAIATSDSKLLQFFPKQVYTKALLTEYIETALTLRAKEIRYSFSIFNKAENCYAGSTSFMNISNDNDSIEIGATWLGRHFHGTGINQQCKYLMLNYAFNFINAHRVEFKTDERNIQSRKAIEKIGAKFKGTPKEYTVMSDGFRRNTCCYRLLKTEWKNLNQNDII